MKLIIKHEKELEEPDYVDRAGDKVGLKGVKLANLRKNPVVLVAHDYNCSSVCKCFGYVPEGTYYKYKISRFVCMHSKFNNKKTGHKIINKKYVVCGKAPDWCPKGK